MDVENGIVSEGKKTSVVSSGKMSEVRSVGRGDGVKILIEAVSSEEGSGPRGENLTEDTGVGDGIGVEKMKVVSGSRIRVELDSGSWVVVNTPTRLELGES